MSSGARRLAEDVLVPGDVMESVEDPADIVVQACLSCSSEAELERVADSLGVEVQTQSGIRVAQRQFGPVRVVASVSGASRPGNSPEAPSALPPRGAPAMTRREIALWLADEEQGRHWSQAECWCHASHPAESADLILVPPPWDASRRLEWV